MVDARPKRYPYRLCPWLDIVSFSRTYESLSLLLGSGGLGLCSLLAVASDHDDAEEGAHDGGTEENQDDGDADGPDARREDAVEGVVGIDEGLPEGNLG